MKISIVVPCYNEINTIGTIISRINNVFSKYDYEIIIIDDHSNDGSKDFIIKNFSETKKYLLIFNDKNYGKGHSLNLGFQKATGDIICIQDADLEYDPHDLLPMVKLILEDKADVVFGSRFRGNGPVMASFFVNRFANFIISVLTNIFSNLSLTDIECCYKVFKKKDINQIVIEEKRFGIEPELTIKLSKLKLRIFEMGISYFGRSKEEGKKIGVKDGFRAIYCIFKYSIFR